MQKEEEAHIKKSIEQSQADVQLFLLWLERDSKDLAGVKNQLGYV